MFNNQTATYFATIRKISVAFGTLFDNIYISRYSGNGGKGTVIKTIKVPFAYAEGQKWLNHLEEDITVAPAVTLPANKKTRVRKSLPRMSFELTSLQYDQSRKLQTMSFNSVGSPTDVTKFLKQLNPIPYDIGFDLNIAVANLDDGLQIIEQILPNFSPSFNLTIMDIPELNISRDVSVIFAGITKQDTYQGSYEDERVITWTLSFVVKGYIYPAIKENSVIRKTIDGLYNGTDITEINNKVAVIETGITPDGSAVDDTWLAESVIYENLDSNGDPII